jgi:hypothetical protein
MRVEGSYKLAGRPTILRSLFLRLRLAELNIERQRLVKEVGRRQE